MNFLKETELKFYERHLMLDTFGVEAQKKLKHSSVLVVGAGGLGCPVLQYLVSAGVGRLGIVDDDRIEISNLQRQFLYQMKDVGECKANVAAKKLAGHNPHVVIDLIVERLSPQNVTEIFSNYEIIVDGSDNFETRYLVNDACVLLNKPLIFGAIFKFEGQLSVFNFNGGPTYRCLFPQAPDADARPSCAEAGVLGVLPGIIGSLQALEVIKVITGIGKVLSGQVVLFDALKQQFSKVELELDQKNLNITDLEDMPNEISCTGTDINTKPDPICEISPQELVEFFGHKKAPHIIDVRENWEREIDSINPSLHIPLGYFSDQSVRQILPPDFLDEIIVYCKAGVRSREACEILHSMGYQKLNNLQGGMMRWQSEKMPTLLE